MKDLALAYLFLDGSVRKTHDGAGRTGADRVKHHHRWCAGAGRALAPAGSESTDAWAEFLDELKGRGLRPLQLAISDAALGHLSALEQVFPQPLRQKCLIHRGLRRTHRPRQGQPRPDLDQRAGPRVRRPPRPAPAANATARTRCWCRARWGHEGLLEALPSRTLHAPLEPEPCRCASSAGRAPARPPSRPAAAAGP